MSFTRTLRAVGGAVVAGALLFGAAPAASADQIRGSQWPLSNFEAENVWKEATGKGVTVAVIDQPVNGSHPDLQGNVLPGKSFVDGGRADHADASTTNDHGTAMAALIAAHGHGPGNSDGVKGLAPDAKILPVAMPEVGDGVEHAGLGGAIRYAVDHGANVINISMVVDFLTDSDKRALAYAAQKNVLVVVGSGNDGKSELGSLAAAPGVVAVGAVDKAGQVWEKSNSGSQLMLTAPGVSITSATSSNEEPYERGSGTSDSTAYVSAAAALLRSKFPDLTAGQIVNRLVKTAGLPPSKAGLTLPDPHYGYGFIRPLRALTQDIPAGSKNGPLKMPQADPSATASGASSAGASGDQASGQKSSGIKPMLLVGVGVGVLVVIGIIVLVVVRQKKNGRNGPPPGGFGGPGGPGGPAGPGFPQQPANPYQQQPNGPGAFPPPPNQYPGQ
ncbi:peptidase M8 [Streptomyces sp. CB02959]|uniref:S8 family serine peptidase n=1 Tax=Streptomyces sp. CB02959 TaxID=2020330 RepID=UPI000C274634|nr:S8 family serine peptidase [Streptomyces sp. CB02959]PJN42182.1 peptidase M8 [Streptomyces sp. CB02959]